MHPDTAENGQIAVDMVLGGDKPYHLILMDNLMPVMVTQLNTIITVNALITVCIISLFLLLLFIIIIIIVYHYYYYC